MSSLRKQRVQHQVAQNVERQRQMFIQNLGVVTDEFLGGERVQIPSDGIHGARDFLGGARGAAFEQHVLDEVRKAVLLESFGARAGADPHPTHTERTWGICSVMTRTPFAQSGDFDIAHKRVKWLA